MGLKVRLELAGYRNQSEGKLLHGRIPSHCLAEYPAGVVYRFSNLVFFSYQSCADSCRGDG